MTKEKTLSLNLKYFVLKCGNVVCIARSYKKALRRQKEFLKTTKEPVVIQEMEQMNFEDFLLTIEPNKQIWVEE